MSNIEVKVNYFSDNPRIADSRSSIVVLDESNNGLAFEAMQRGGLFFWGNHDNMIDYMMSAFELEPDMRERLKSRENFDRNGSDALETLQGYAVEVRGVLDRIYTCWGNRAS